MTPEQFADAIKALPPDTPLTAAHIVGILSALKPSSTVEQAYSEWDKDKLIDQKVLSSWLGESESTLEKWRKVQKGPVAIYKTKKVSYRVGDVRDWIESGRHASTALNREAKINENLQALGLKAFGTIFDSVFPHAIVDDKLEPFFIESDERDIQDYQVLWAEQDSLPQWLLNVDEIGMDVDLVTTELDSRLVSADVNQLETFIKNGNHYQATLGHILAMRPYGSFDDYNKLLAHVLNRGLATDSVDSENNTVLDLASKFGNEDFILMVNRYKSHEKLTKELN